MTSINKLNIKLDREEKQKLDDAGEMKKTKLTIRDHWDDSGDKFLEIKIGKHEACCVKATNDLIYVLQCADGNDVYSDIGGADFSLRKLTSEEYESVIKFCKEQLEAEVGNKEECIMKIEMTNERPNIIHRMKRGKYSDPIKEFIKSDEKFIVFRFDDGDNYQSARNSIHVAIERNGYGSKIVLRSSKKDRIVYLEKKYI